MSTSCKVQIFTEGSYVGSKASDIEVWSAADSSDRTNVAQIRQPLLAGVDPTEGEAGGASTGGGGEGGTPAELRLERRVKFAIYLSLGANVVLLVAKLMIYVVTLSNSIMASLVDSVVDILSQLVLALAEYKMKVADPRYPVGKTRLETIGVIISAGIMSVCSIEVIQSSVLTLWRGLVDKEPTFIHLDVVAYAVLGVATAAKIALFVFCSTMKEKSGAALALTEDHLNDILSNCVALLTAALASNLPQVWWVDSAGGALISVYIIVRWIVVAMEHTDKLVGKGADETFVQVIKDMADNHHKMLMPDEIRAYFFGQKYFVELEVILPANMSVQHSHDIGLDLQHKIEALDEVERAFVHIDYQNRETPEHRTERELTRTSSARRSPHRPWYRHHFHHPCGTELHSSESTKSPARRRTSRGRPDPSPPADISSFSSLMFTGQLGACRDRLTLELIADRFVGEGDEVDAWSPPWWWWDSANERTEHEEEELLVILIIPKRDRVRGLLLRTLAPPAAAAAAAAPAVMAYVGATLS
ncbi:cation efflux protein [Chloropicon primus]|uniref:Cation efflux protein n=2 Tax=Chloropicon primus TaxID=1764295 RepID=A0A5B8MIX2_9CHLO|nr:cation efflux protein [Chloropicon primus]UPQ99431.1 cation efflux protein [Chloropicon primus]|eukprot:QDZ20221.1 cation efflux protein [Chloropicon primus]